MSTGVGILLLSPELQLRIFDFILEPPEGKDYGCHFVPAHLQNLIQISCTCRTFRTLLTPFIYGKLYLKNTGKGAISVKAVADGPFSHLVKELIFVGRAPASNEERYNDTEAVFPEELETVLTNLNKFFPRLGSLDVKFGYGLDVWDWTTYERWPDSPFEDYEQNETDEQMLSQEEKCAFRALIDKALTAISLNTSVKHLKMRQFAPRMPSTYSSDSFRNFLAGVQKFELSIWSDNSNEWSRHVEDGHQEGTAKSDLIFSALTSCADFTLDMEDPRSYAHEGLKCFPPPLCVGQMPLSRRLTLHYCIVSFELLEFLQDHKNTLEEIVLQNCEACIKWTTGLGETIIDWREFFDALLCMKVLKKFEIFPMVGPDDSPLSNNGEAEFAQSDSRRIFLYSWYDESYSAWLPDNDVKSMYFTSGDDQRSWETLLAMIENQRND